MAIVKRLPALENNSKAFLQKIFIAAISLIIGLVATVWAITWKATDNHINKTDAVVKENTQILVEIQKFMAQQTVINENQEKFFGDQHELMLKVLEEIQKK